MSCGGTTSIAATISVGVAEASGDMTVPTELVHRADTMLYACKAAGRNCVIAYERSDAGAAAEETARSIPVTLGVAASR